MERHSVVDIQPLAAEIGAFGWLAGRAFAYGGGHGGLAARGPEAGPFGTGWAAAWCSAGAAGVLLGLLVWFGAELMGGGRQASLAERVLAGA